MKLTYKALFLLFSVCAVSTATQAVYKCCSLDTVALCGDDCCKTECDADGKCPNCESGETSVDGKCCPNDKKDFVTDDGKCCSNTATYDSDKDCYCAKNQQDSKCSSCAGANDWGRINGMCCASGQGPADTEYGVCCKDGYFYNSEHQKYDKINSSYCGCPAGGTESSNFGCCIDSWYYSGTDKKRLYISDCGCPAESISVDGRYSKSCCKGKYTWSQADQEWNEEDLACACAGGESFVRDEDDLFYFCKGNSVDWSKSATIKSDDITEWNVRMSVSQAEFRQLCNYAHGSLCEGQQSHKTEDGVWVDDEYYLVCIGEVSSATCHQNCFADLPNISESRRGPCAY